MSEQSRYRLTGGLFLLSVAVIFLPMLFDGDGVPGVALKPIDSDYEPPAVGRFEVPVPASDLSERMAELRAAVDEQGFHRKTGTRMGEPVLDTPNEDTEAWAVQLGSFAEQKRALEFQNRLRGDGLEAFVSSYKPPEGKVHYRVAIGPLLDGARAKRLRGELSGRYDVEARIMAFGS